MRILAIETSCDDTGLALIETDNKGRLKILANLVSSQIQTHRPWGGVVPNLAKREHQKSLPLLYSKIRDSRFMIHDLDLIAVTEGPGLAPCLWAGINFAQDLARKLNKPLVGINHLKGHIYSALLGPRNPKSQEPNHKQIPNHKFPHSAEAPRGRQTLNNLEFPILTLIVSGGHTELVFSKKLGHYQIIGETRDDAAGEAFDKVAKLLGLGYPGGPMVEKLATKGNPLRFNLPRPMINSKNFDFSFSGLKTAVLYLIKGIGPTNPGSLKLTQKNIADLCASFEQAVVDVLVTKTILAAKKLTPKTLILGGGVAANKKLRFELERSVTNQLKTSKLILPPVTLTGDNALMIALAAYAELMTCDVVTVRNDIACRDINLIAQPNLRLEK